MYFPEIKTKYKLVKGVIFILIILITTTGFSQRTGKKPKYIFLFIGDGMGLVQSQIANEYQHLVAKDSLSFMYFPVQGLCSTRPSSGLITCSAASATALATGKKTCEGYIGIDCSDGSAPTSFIISAKEKGFKTAVISSVSIDHATPAAFYAHDNSRNNYFNIGSQLSKSGINFFAGGGYEVPNDLKTGVNLYDIDKNAGYVLVRSKGELASLPSKTDKVHIFNDGPLGNAIDKPKNQFLLTDFVEKAINTLYNPKGFVMMIEGGKIDWACHKHDAATAIQEIVAFDDAIRKALEFYNQHPDETLIIVTSDHETGGMSLGCESTHYNAYIPLLRHQKNSIEFFGSMVSEWSSKDISFSNLTDSLKKYYGFNSCPELMLTEIEIQRIKKAFEISLLKHQNADNRVKEKMYYERGESISQIATEILNERSGIGWTTSAHTGVMVPVRAIGAGSENFLNIVDNTYIAKKIFELLEIPYPN